jgi:hypothetical protein
MSSTLLETSLAETLVFIALALNGLANLDTGLSNWLEIAIDPNTRKRLHVFKEDVYFNASSKEGLEQAKL